MRRSYCNIIKWTLPLRLWRHTALRRLAQRALHLMRLHLPVLGFPKARGSSKP